MKKDGDIYLRNVVFGISDSLVSTVGLLSGAAAGGIPRQTLVLTGIIYAFVEAFSMAVGSYLSEQSTEEYAVRGETSNQRPLLGGVIMFLSFILVSFIPILPYLLFNADIALWVSIVASVLALFIVGSISAKITNVKILSHAFKMALLGGAAIVLGVIVGKFVKAA
ncbi:MAG: VIT1/CCC1 transporter family protein [Patescibacteria group bacterium]